jgi:hypothetical protein
MDHNIYFEIDLMFVIFLTTSKDIIDYMSNEIIFCIFYETCETCKFH